VGNVKNSSDKVLFVEHHHEGVHGAAWSYVAAHSNGGGKVLSTLPAQRSSLWSPARHRIGLAVAFCDGSARVIPFSQWFSFTEDWPNGNWAYTGVGPNWDLDRP
jgi:hypothetical protein